LGHTARKLAPDKSCHFSESLELRVDEELNSWSDCTRMLVCSASRHCKL